MPVFGRDGDHPYDEALVELLDSHVIDQAMARNLMHDHRVSKEREAVFDIVGGSPRTRGQLERAVRRYFLKRVQTRERPDYIYTGINGNNIITGKAGIKHSIHPEAKLARALDLNGLWNVFRWAKLERRWGRTFVGLRDAWDTVGEQEAVSDWLDKKLLSASPDAAGEFVAVVFDVLNQYRRSKPYQPSWATPWATLKPIERFGPERWLEVLGMMRPAPCWVVLLTYTFAEAGTVVRPTVLDADWCPHNFPSPPPPHTKLEDGGHPMDLRSSPRATRPRPEFIHRQIDHFPHHFRNIGKTKGPTKGDLSSQRKAHHKMLIDYYGPAIKDWMDSPI